MKKIVQLILKWLAKAVLARYRPKIVGITGSVGKTSAKEAIYAVLAKNFRVRRGVKNYNNEIGVPLVILGEESPGKSIGKWLVIFLRTIKMLAVKKADYPEVLVLEMGVDRPGDMDYLSSIVRCDVGVITMVSPAHLEYFGTLENIKKEKAKLVENLKEGGWAILNYDNDYTRQIIKNIKSKILTYGFEEGADLRAQAVKLSGADNLHQVKEKQSDLIYPIGISFKMCYQGSFVPVFLPKVIGRPAVYSALAAAAVGISQGFNLVEISQALKYYKPPLGRMNFLAGINDSLIIDDTYNSSPPAVIAGLELIKEIPIPAGAKKIAVLGDMLELGSYSQQAHQEIGRYAVSAGINKIICVGARSLDTVKAAAAAGLAKENLFHFADAESAGRFLLKLINKGDLLFVKGSQGMRMEKAVKMIMLEPEKAKSLLVRQDNEWLKK